MRPRRLRPALLAALAALLLVAGLAPAQASASEAADETAEAETITTVLQPGWNMVGWVGPETPVADLFDALPALQRVSAWDAEGQEYQRATRASSEEFPALTPGMGLWLHLGGTDAVQWTRSVSGEAVLLSLRSGWNLVGWTGDNGTEVDEAVARFGDMFVRGAVWDPSTQRYVQYLPRSGNTEPPVLSRGDAVWVELTSDARWWQPGKARPRFVFTEDVPTGERQAVLESLESARAVFAERLGVYTTDFEVHVGVDACTGGDPVALTRMCASTPELVAHEYFHVLQSHTAPGARAPTWLEEGSASYADTVYLGVVDPSSTVGESLQRRRQFALLGPAYSTGALASVETYEGFHGTRRSNYGLGFLAADWLASHAGERALIEYYRLRTSVETWESAFESAFGISVEHFYEQFEVYRETATFETVFTFVFGISPQDFDGDLEPYRNAVGRPLAHSLDEVVEPVIVFVGDVPADTRLDIETQVANVHTLLTERMGFQPYEFSLYFAADDESGRLAYFELYRSGAVGGTYRCSLGSTWYIFHSMTCKYAFTYGSIIGSPFGQLLSNTSYQHHPHWLILAGTHYARALYREEYERSSLNDEVSFARRRAAAYRVPLQQLDTHSGWSEADIGRNWDLAFLAAHWLAGHAGEQALAQYYRLLPKGDPDWEDYQPRAGSWQAAFEQAFGLTLEDFYEQFEAYRAELSQP